MVVLALETTTAAGSVAVARGSDVLVERIGDPGVPHGRRLPGDLLAALDEAGLALRDVDLFAVASGPGAFTGLRIGIATIQGLAFAHERQVVAVSALEALASAAMASSAEEPDTLVAPWMDAARREVFAALYRVIAASHPGRAASLESVDDPSVGAAAATLERWRGPLHGRDVLFTGEGARRYTAVIDERLGPTGWRLAPQAPIASAVARLAAARAGQAGPPHAVRPLYVRRPDAELARERTDRAEPSERRTGA
jgi:tRNA threonylcarbamoyladenosine biosynthesis protein TsaB